MEDEAVEGIFEWDETVAFDEEAQYVGRIGVATKNEIKLEALPRHYWQYKELFEDKKAEMLAPRRTFDHAIELKEGTEPPWGPIYPMSAYHLRELDKYLREKLAQGKIVESSSPDGAPILFVPKPNGSL